ncbi:MAG: (Fe-S)-binding protein [Desulfobacterales bacterium]
MFLSEAERRETLWACRFCMMCHVADRVAAVLRRESYTPRGRANVLWALEKGMLAWDAEAADLVYTAVNDGLLERWCVGNYPYEELIVDARARFFQKGAVPEEIRRRVEAIHAGREAGPAPAEILRAAGVATQPGSPWVLFAGCNARRRSPQSLIHLGQLFNAAGIPFQVLEDEPCCGWTLYQLGDFEGAGAFSRRIADRLRRAGARDVIVIDADCLRMFTTRTVRFGGEVSGITFRHAVEILAEWLRGERLAVRRPIPGPVTYHDPCALARYRVTIDPPRRILQRIVEGELREMEAGGPASPCCGAGGMLAEYKPEVAQELAAWRLREAAETGARLLATACTRCDGMFRSAREADSSLPAPEVANLIDLVALAVAPA